MVEHPLHMLVGNAIYNEFAKKFAVLRDPACGGDHSLPLFNSREKSGSNEFCDADMLIIKDNKIKAIFEIEEANIKPTQICGKFLTSALSCCYIYERATIEMDDSTIFIQILDNLSLKPNSAKENQWKNLERGVSKIIPVKDSKIKHYKLLFGNAKDFNFDPLIQYLNEVLVE